MNIQGTRTEKNLLAAFAGESQARNRYLQFASQAKNDGLIYVAEVFEETAQHELSHAKNFFKFLEGGAVEITATYQAGKVGTTRSNLELSIEAEHQEWSNDYIHFAETAKQESFTAVAAKFKTIAKAEEQHEKRFKYLLNLLIDEKMFVRDQEVEWKCIKCGYVHEGTKAPKACPACAHPQSYFRAIEAIF